MIATWAREADPADDDSWMQWMERALKRVRREAQAIDNHLRSQRYKLERDWMRKLKDTESYLQKHPGDLVATAVNSEAQLKLENLTMDALDNHQHEMSAMWFRYGERCTRQFFTFHKTR